jgi:hypothetical protein
MKTSFKELKEAQPALLRILSAPMDVKLAYRLSKIVNKVDSQFKAIEKQRRELVDKYGEKKDDATRVPDKRMPEFEKDWNSFMEKEFDLDIQLMPWEVIEISGVKLSPMDISLLEKFIDMPEKMR